MRTFAATALVLASITVPRVAHATDELEGSDQPRRLRFLPLGSHFAALLTPGENESPAPSSVPAAARFEIERPPSRFSIVAMLVGGALLAGDGLLSIAFGLLDFLGPASCPYSLCGTHARAVKNVLGAYSMATGVIAEGFGVGLLVAGLRRHHLRNEFYSATRVSLAAVPGSRLPGLAFRAYF